MALIDLNKLRSQYKRVENKTQLYRKVLQVILYIGLFVTGLVLVTLYFVVVFDGISIEDKYKNAILNFIPGIATPALGIPLTSFLFSWYYSLKKEEGYLEARNYILGSVGLLNVRAAGITNIHPNLYHNLSEIRERFTRSKEICVLTTFFEEAIFTQHELTQAVINGCISLKILMLNPNSPVVSIREKAIGSEDFKDFPMHDRIISKIREFKYFEDRIKRNNNKNENFKIEIRYYDTLPPAYFCLMDDYAIVGFYWHAIRATQTIMVETEGENSDIGKRLKEEFTHIWEKHSIEAVVSKI